MDQQQNATPPGHIGPFAENDITTRKNMEEPDDRPLQIVWKNVIFTCLFHCIAVYGFILCFARAKFTTVIFAFFLYLISNFGVTAGVHRLWAHRAYKAKWPLKLILILCQTLAYQNSVIVWSRDHRVHHKFQETDADPHNAKRGFFFSHVGWVLCKKHEQVKIKGKAVDLSDLYAERLVRFQHKYYLLLVLIITFILPTAIPMYFWDEPFVNSFCVNTFRWIGFLHITSTVNSIAHLWGSKPYDKYINPVENFFVSLITNGEGWHNYHHTFPWDYKAAELGRINSTKYLIEFFAKIGWAYDLKTVSKEAVRSRVIKTGDGTHEIWGWGDKDQTHDNYKAATIYYRKDDE